jgi:transposase
LNNPHNGRELTRAFVQSGFNEVGRQALLAVVLPTSQKPPGSRSIADVIRHGDLRRFAMPIPLRTDFDAAQLRAIAKRTRDAPQARRLLALAAVYEGASRTEAARIGGVTLQIVRDWVIKFNAQGPEGLIDRKAPGQPSRLSDAHRSALAAAIESGPIPAVHGVVRWRLIDLAQWLWEEFRVSVSRQTLSRELRALGYRKLSARPRHPAQAEGAIAAFKIYGPAVRRKRAVAYGRETVRINLSGLCVEPELRTIMEIRAHRACLDLRPQRAIFKTRFAVRRATVRPSCHILLANLGGTLSSE